MADPTLDPPDVVLDLLGGRAVLDGDADALRSLLAALRDGLPYGAVGRVADRAQLAVAELLDVLGISERTAARRKLQGRLTAIESDRLYRVARIVALAGAVLGSAERAAAWLTTPHRGLDGARPLALLDTDLGTREVEDELHRLSYGIFA